METPQKSSELRAERSESRLAARALSYLRSPAAGGMVVLAAFVGVASGYGVVVFRWLLATAHGLFFGGLGGLLSSLGPYSVVLLPAAGGLIVGPLVYLLAHEARGHGVPEIMLAVAHQGGRIRARVPLVKALAAAITIGSGGSAGQHGPAVEIGSALGSLTAKGLGLTTERVRLLVAGGAAAGIAATFNAPIGGVVFALEVILRDFTTRSFGVVVISSVSAVVISHAYLGDSPAFRVPRYSLVSVWEFALYLLLGVAAALVARAFIRVLYGSMDLFAKWEIADYLKPALGGLAVGVIGIWSPEVLGIGHDTSELALAGRVGLAAMAVLLFVKLAATSLTLGSGGSGGIFAPALFLGAMLGGVLGNLFHTALPGVTATAGAYALVGMGAVFAGAAHAPMTAILILFEMTGDYRIIGPLMVATSVSSVLSEFLGRESIYTLKLARRGVDVLGAEPDLLDTIRVAEAMATDFEVVSPAVPASELMQKFARGEMPSLPVVDSAGELTGIVSRSDVEEAVLRREGGRTAGEIMTARPVTSLVDESLTLALQRLSARDVAALPVLDPAHDNRLVGMLRRRDIIAAHQRARVQRPELAAQIDRLQGAVPGAGVLELAVGRGSPVADKEIRTLTLPPDTLLVAVRHADRTVIPRGDTVLRPGDRVVALASREHLDELRRIFVRPAAPD